MYSVILPCVRQKTRQLLRRQPLLVGLKDAATHKFSNRRNLLPPEKYNSLKFEQLHATKLICRVGV